MNWFRNKTETKNKSVWQDGGAYLNNKDVFIAPEGKVIVAVNVITDKTSFKTLEQIDGINANYIGTAIRKNTDGKAIAPAHVFPKGQWIYGKWSSCALDEGDVFLYFGEE